MNLPSSSCIFPCHPVHVLWRVQCSMSIFIAMGPYYSRFIRVCSAVVKIQGCVTYSGQRNKLPLAPVFEAVRFVNPQPRACWKPSHRHCSWKKLRVAASFSQWFPTFEFILTDPLLGVTILPEYFPNLLLGIMILQEYFPDFLLGLWPPTVKEANVINNSYVSKTCAHACCTHTDTDLYGHIGLQILVRNSFLNSEQFHSWPWHCWPIGKISICTCKS